MVLVGGEGGRGEHGVGDKNQWGEPWRRLRVWAGYDDEYVGVLLVGYDDGEAHNSDIGSEPRRWRGRVHGLRRVARGAR